MPAAPTIAWLAFSSAETDWDAKFYFGASIWYAADPERVLDWLHEVEAHGNLWTDLQVYDLHCLHHRLRSAAEMTEGFKAAKVRHAAAEAGGNNPPPLVFSRDHIQEAARTLRTDLESKKASAKRDYDAIWEGSEKLRRALARGDLTACGWPGRGPDFSGDDDTLPLREPIPRDVFLRPVTVTQYGVLTLARGVKNYGHDYDILWSGLLFDSADLLTLRPLIEDEGPSIPYAPPADEAPPDRGGVDPKHDWRPFEEECRQNLQKLLNEKPDSDPRRKLTRHMHLWAERNMKPAPHLRTIRGRAKDVFLAVTQAQPSPAKR